MKHCYENQLLPVDSGGSLPQTDMLLTLGAHARGLLLFVCLSVCLSVPALAASAPVETSKQRYSRVSLRLFLV